MSRLILVTATTDPIRALPTLRSWGDTRLIVVVNGSEVTLRHELPQARWICHPEILGTVPAFAIGVQAALEEGADIIACLHDDLEIHDSQWAPIIYTFLLQHPAAGLVGFGGGRGLGDPDLYQKPYSPMQLARKDFISNMVDAENHGRRVILPTRVACLDGFSQIGRREFWESYAYGRALADFGGVDGSGTNPIYIKGNLTDEEWGQNLFARMQAQGIVHHAYDGVLGCWAKRLGWEAWMLPIRCRHLGGQTAVGDPRYHQWATKYTGADPALETGDQVFWLSAHRIWYEYYRDVLPILVEESHAATHPV